MAFHHRLARVSRDRRWILRTGLRLALVFVALGLVASVLRAPLGQSGLSSQPASHPSPEVDEEDPASLAQWIRDLKVPRRGMATASPFGLPEVPETPFPLPLPPQSSPPVPGSDSEEIALLRKLEDPRLEQANEQLARARVSDEEETLLLALAESLYGGEEIASAARATLGEAAGKEPPIRHASAFYGDALFRIAEYEVARDAYLREVRAFPEADWSRERLRALVLVDEDDRALRELTKEFPDLFEGASVTERLQAAILLEDWIGIAKATIEMDYLHIDLGLLAFSLLAASIWFVIVTQFAGYEPPRAWLYAGSLVLGVLSASAALFAVILHEQVFGFQPQGDFLQTAIFYIAGVGLREESLKLILFLPLLPALLKRSEIDALVCGGLVGLGFALQENLSYYERNISAIVARLFSANFVHIALTGLLALATWRLARRRNGKAAELWLATFLGVVVFHGLYDVFVVSGDQFLGLVVFVAITYRFLDEAESLGRVGPHRALSPLATTFLGSIVLLGIGFVYAAAKYGLVIAITLSGIALFSVTTFGIVFFLRFKEH